MEESRTVNPVPLFNPDSEQEDLEIEEYLDSREDMYVDDDESGTFPQPSTAASSGTAFLFHRNPDSPLFRVGDKRPAQQEEDEADRKQKEERRKNQMRAHVRAIQFCDSVC
jgi:hypothetical protein